ncbi:uncharacterized protein RCC_00260 [Ramularia collo-cygni]|uniref:SnoaL-like domain-containing protein n=1 Tax=Ramularia collo-cygni TaxID=112498 RepID=A0A2D3UNW1_9PEZI|nr:uncharacterized protein RCC_00260 [Ramularia collo-cygni]CZT14285.1 uncharacterized protein RCC_00260 [Ramularia collo-cygni]
MSSTGSVTPTTSTTSTALTERHLVTLSTDMVLACNTRYWDTQSYPWTHLSPSFLSGPTFATIPVKLDLTDFINAFSEVYDSNPDYHILVVSTAVHMSDKPGEAQVYANIHNVNFTPGVVRYSIGLWDYREAENGKWMCVSYRSLPGPTG